MKKLIYFITVILMLILVYQPSQAQDYPVAHNDTLEFTLPIEEDTIYVHNQLLANDYWPDSIDVDFYIADMIGIPSHFIIDTIALQTNSISNEYFAQSGLVDAGYYEIKNADSSHPDLDHLDSARAGVYFKINNHNHDTINVNNISARINNYGNQFWNMEDNHFEVPKGDSTHTMFTSSLWIGGVDENDSLHLAAQLYRYGPELQTDNASDYWAGPVSDMNNQQYEQKWKYNIWKLNREEIIYHKNHWQDAGYEPIEPIATWPGNGDTENGEAEQLAPYYDNNNNGVYEPRLGDYPIIRGDQAIFYIFNDNRHSHTETKGTPLGVEIHAMAYAYDKPHDSLLNNTLFLHYDIYNRSDSTYYDTYLGLFADIDVGNPYDDYVKSDLQNNIFYGYNGDSIDETHINNSGDTAKGYGENPPAQAIQFIAGPTIDGDNEDNPAFEGDCSIFDFNAPEGNADKGYAINGMNFGDEVIDNERFGMSRFIYFNNIVGNPAGPFMHDPEYAPDYYNYLKGIWKDNTPMVYGGYGHESAGGYGPEANFMFPGESDTCFWGTNGEEPDGPVNWTEESAGNEPGDRRGLGVTGPFTFEAHSKKQLDIAYVYARSETEGMNSEELLRNHANNINTMAQNNQLELEEPGEVIGVDEPTTDQTNIKLYPNPTHGNIHVQGLDAKSFDYEVYDLTGRKIESGRSNNHSIRMQSLETGFYILRIEAKGKSHSLKFFLK